MARSCSAAKYTNATPGKKHLDWQTLQQALPDVPRVLIGHLGEEARRVARSSGKVRICDDLDSLELGGVRTMDRVEHLRKFIAETPDDPFRVMRSRSS